MKKKKLERENEFLKEGIRHFAELVDSHLNLEDIYCEIAINVGKEKGVDIDSLNSLKKKHEEDRESYLKFLSFYTEYIK